MTIAERIRSIPLINTVLVNDKRVEGRVQKGLTSSPERIAGVLAQSTLSLEIRGFEESDYPRLAEIYDAIFPERSRSVEEWQFYDDSLDKSKYYFRRYACINSATGVALGFGEMWNPPWMFHPKKFWFDGWVDLKP